MSAALTPNDTVVAIAVAALSASKRMTASCCCDGEPEPGSSGREPQDRILLAAILETSSRTRKTNS
jgi:hypothetical protein